MFWDNEELEKASKLAVFVLGDQGKYVVGEQLYCVYVESYGKIWYGDLSLTSDLSKLEELRDLVREAIYVLRDTRVDDDRSFMNQAVMTLEMPTMTFTPQPVSRKKK